MRELETAVTRNRAVFESSLDAVIAIDNRGCVVEFNPAATQIFGYSREEAVGQPLAQLNA